MKHLISYDRLNDVPGLLKEYDKKPTLKYDKGDLVVFKSLNKVFKVKSINLSSLRQDYYIVNPFDTTEAGWVSQEELKKPTKKQIADSETLSSQNKFNL